MEKRKPTIREIKKRFMSGELFEPVHRKVDLMQARLSHKNFEVEILKPLSNEELSLLENTTDFGLPTYRGLFELAEIAGEGLSNQAELLSLDSLLLRERMQRRGIECDVFGIAGPLYLLQTLPPGIGALAYWFTSRVYLRTMSKGAFQARKDTGEADKKMVNFLLKLINSKKELNKFIDLSEISVISGDLVTSGSFSRYIKEWWGIGPAIAICISSILAENFVTPAVSMLVLGLYQLFNKKESKGDEIERMVQASEKKVDIQAAGVASSVLSKTIGASILAAVTVAQTDVTARQFYAMKPEHDENYRKVNTLIVDSVRAVRSGVIVNDHSSALTTGLIKDLLPNFQQWFASMSKVDLDIFGLSKIEDSTELLNKSLELLTSEKYLTMLDGDDIQLLSTVQSMSALLSNVDQTNKQHETVVIRSLILVILVFSKMRSKLGANNVDY